MGADHLLGIPLEGRLGPAPQPVLYQPADEHESVGRQRRRGHARAQQAAGGGPGVGLGQVAQEDLLAGRAAHQRQELVHVFTFESHDLYRLAGLRLVGEHPEDLQQGRLDARERVFVVGVEDHPVDEGQRGVLAHRKEQLALVAEMPIHRAAGHPGGGGDLFEGGVAHPALQKHPARSIDDVQAGDLGFFFRFTNHRPVLKSVLSRRHSPGDLRCEVIFTHPYVPGYLHTTVFV